MPHGCAMSTLSYLFSRLLQIIPTFLIVMVIIFLLVRALPGDPAIAMADAKATTEQLEQIRQRLGLDQPLWIQFGIFVKNVFTGNLGDSILMKAPVTQVILERLPASGFLTLYAVLFSLLIAGATGLCRRTQPQHMARHHHSLGLSSGAVHPSFLYRLAAAHLFGGADALVSRRRIWHHLRTTYVSFAAARFNGGAIHFRDHHAQFALLRH